MDSLNLIIATTAGYILGDFIMSLLSNAFYKEEPNVINRVMTRTYNFYDENGEQLDPKNKEVLQTCLKTMEDSCERLREDIRKLEEEENKDA